MYFIAALISCGGLVFVASTAFGHKAVLQAQHEKFCKTPEVKTLEK